MNTIAAIKQGDEFIFEQVFQQYHEKVYLFVFHKTNSSWMAEEVTQLTFIKLWRYRTSLDEGLPLAVQLFRMVRTSMIDQLRKNIHEGRLHQQLQQNVHDLQPAEATAAIEANELQEQLLHAIRQMPGKRRQVFEMSRLKGMSYREIATELSLSVKTVENHISHALKQLRHFFTLLVVIIFLLISR